MFKTHKYRIWIPVICILIAGISAGILGFTTNNVLLAMLVSALLFLILFFLSSALLHEQLDEEIYRQIDNEEYQKNHGRN